jgi:hypothetical protein
MSILEFQGPFTLVSRSLDALGDCPLKDEHGVYLWCVPTANLGYAVDYVGETGDSFYKRTKEHVIRTLGGDYEVCDPVALRKAEYSIIWRGLWRKGTRDSLPDYLRHFEDLAPRIRAFLELHQLFLGPTDVDDRMRKRIEASIAGAVRSTTPCLLSPDVRYIPRKKGEPEVQFVLRFPCRIHGLPGEVVA